MADNVPVLVTSAKEVGANFGRGFMVHRLAQKCFAGSGGVETWVAPVAEIAGTPSAGDIDFVGSTATENGTLHLYIAYDYVPVTITSGDDEDAIAISVAAAINADLDLPVTAAVNGVTTSQVDITAKSQGTAGDEISLEFNLGFQQVFPAGVVATVTDMAGATGDPTSIGGVLTQLGQGDDQNKDFYTEICHGFGTVTAVLDELHVYNGIGNDYVGNYAKIVARPFRSLIGSTENDLSVLIAASDARKLDRTNGIVCTPVSASHPQETAALALGIMAKTNNDRAAESYIGKPLPGVHDGQQQALVPWTSSYTNRDTAVKAGLSPTKLENGVLVLQNVMTSYHPDTVPIENNGYASQRNISITQNVLWNIKRNFEQEKWQSFIIVEDTAKVTNSIDREKARDIDAVLDDLLALTFSFEGHAWIFTAAFTIERLQAGGLIEIRPGGIGFNATLPLIYSGEGGILDTMVKFDTSLAVLL
jgi:hypothetical protein